jgi:hypothetical protein
MRQIEACSDMTREQMPPERIIARLESDYAGIHAPRPVSVSPRRDPRYGTHTVTTTIRAHHIVDIEDTLQKVTPQTDILSEGSVVGSAPVNLPLTPESIRTASFKKHTVKGRQEVADLAKKLVSGMSLGGYKPVIGGRNILDTISMDECSVFSSGRLNVTFFDASGVKQRKDALEVPIKERYIFSISAGGTVIGHGVVSLDISKPDMVNFRFSIHGDEKTKALRGIDFTGKGYGSEALALIMAISVKGGLFSGPVNWFWYTHSIKEDTRNTRHADKFTKMKSMLSRAGFNDKLMFSMISKPKRITFSALQRSRPGEPIERPEVKVWEDNEQKKIPPHAPSIKFSYTIPSYNTFKKIDRKKDFEDSVRKDPVRSTLGDLSDEVMFGLSKAYLGALYNSFDAIIDRFEDGLSAMGNGEIISEIRIEPEEVVITIEDNGKTIELDPKGEPVRRPKDFNKQLGGMGESHRIAVDFFKKHGGAIKFSTKENGTIVEMRLPLDKLSSNLALDVGTAFDFSVQELRRALSESYKSRGAKLEQTLASGTSNTQSLILYADDILQNTAVVDLEDTIRKVTSQKGILSGGNIVLFAREAANAAIMERMIKDASPNARTVVITFEDLAERRNIKGRETDEVETLVQEARRRGSGEILAVIKGPAKNIKSDPPEDLVDMSRRLKVPVVILGLENALYSFASAIEQAVIIRRQNGEGGWVVSLLPIQTISEDLRVKHEEYLATLRAYIAA